MVTFPTFYSLKPAEFHISYQISVFVISEMGDETMYEETASSNLRPGRSIWMLTFALRLNGRSGIRAPLTMPRSFYDSWDFIYSESHVREPESRGVTSERERKITSDGFGCTLDTECHDLIFRSVIKWGFVIAYIPSLMYCTHDDAFLKLELVHG